MTVIDLFAGGGGASTGIEMALGRSPLLAVNHSEHAIEMHKLNHPSTMHLREDVWAVDPWGAVPRRLRKKIKLLWASPDCKHFSNARGSKPKDKKIRMLPMVVVKWAREIRPDVIGIENVREMQTWGPLYPEDHPVEKLRNKPIPEKKGETWDLFIARLRLLGYQVEWRVLNCANYGAPTSRKRLFILARCDGKPIVWPEATHGSEPGLKPYRTVAEHIDWSVPCPSIFLTKEQASQWYREVGKQHGWQRPPRRPLADNTQRRIARGLVKFVLDNPDPYIVRIGQTSGDSGKVHDIQRPLSTITSKNEHLLVTPHLTKFYGTSTGSDVGEPTPTITGQGQHLGLVSSWLINTRNGERKGQLPRVRDIQRPAPTTTAQGSQGAFCTAWLAKHYTGATGSSLKAPLGAITAKDHHSLVTAFVQKYYGQGTGQEASLPLHTIPTIERFGLVTVTLGGQRFAVVDIGMRMLTARELARCQGFPEDYRLIGTKAEQIARIGNSVPPQAVAALVRANLLSPVAERRAA